MEKASRVFHAGRRSLGCMTEFYQPGANFPADRFCFPIAAQTKMACASDRRFAFESGILQEKRSGQASAHQIWQRIAGGLAIRSPSRQSNARANSDIFDGAAIARKRPRGCGFVLTSRRSYSGRSLDAQIW